MSKHVGIVKPKPLQIIGELMITAGVILLLFVVWQVYVNDPVVGNKQQAEANQYDANSSDVAAREFAFEQPTDKLAQGKVFGKIYIPRFGDDYVRLLGQGTMQKVTLNTVGVGHYLRSQWPGEVGNFAVAAHRTSHGAPFSDIDKLRDGDRIYVETNQSWLTYEYRQTKIVKPTEVGVIDRVPEGMVSAVPGGKYLTLTSCHPKWSNAERIIVWLEQIEERPATSGMPFALKEVRGE
jgi:sortase A